MKVSDGAEALLAALVRRGFAEVEIYEKSGRSRRFVRDAAGQERARHLAASESGWALRAGDLKRSLFFAATGSADPAAPLPDPSPHGLRLPEPVSPAAATHGAWSEPEDSDAPLATESMAATLFAALERDLHRELPSCRLVAARLEDGAAESALLSTAGVRTGFRARAASLRLEVEDRGRRCRFEGAEREARRFGSQPIARRLVDRLCALERQGARAIPGGPLLLAAPLAARLVQALAPLFLGPAARDRIAAWGALSAELTLIDDGRLAAGVLASPVDGEGRPTGEAVLVDRGRFVQPLLAWWEAPRDAAGAAGSGALPGCARRASWRDLPRRAPTHFFVPPSGEAVGDLLGSGGAGAYLLDAEGPVRIDPGSLGLEVAVSGMELAGGRAVAPLGPMRLAGDVRSLLSGVRARARDLHFVPGDGMFGAPTLLLEGFRLLPE